MRNELIDSIPLYDTIYVVCVGDGKATVKRVRISANELELMPDSHDPSFESMSFDAKNPYNTPRVLGRVVWFTVPLDFTLWKLASASSSGGGRRPCAPPGNALR